MVDITDEVKEILERVFVEVADEDAGAEAVQLELAISRVFEKLLAEEISKGLVNSFIQKSIEIAVENACEQAYRSRMEMMLDSCIKKKISEIPNPFDAFTQRERDRIVDIIEKEVKERMGVCNKDE